MPIAQRVLILRRAGFTKRTIAAILDLADWQAVLDAVAAEA